MICPLGLCSEQNDVHLHCSAFIRIGEGPPCMAGVRCQTIFIILRSLSALSWISFRTLTKQLNHSHGPTPLRSWNASLERIYGSLYEMCLCFPLDVPTAACSKIEPSFTSSFVRTCLAIQIGAKDTLTPCPRVAYTRDR